MTARLSFTRDVLDKHILDVPYPVQDGFHAASHVINIIYERSARWLHSKRIQRLKPSLCAKLNKNFLSKYDPEELRQWNMGWYYWFEVLTQNGPYCAIVLKLKRLE